MDKLDAMRMFVRVVDRGRFSAVAKELGVGQPAVSKQISALENELGAQLIHRSSRAITLTEAGRDFYASALHILDAFENAIAVDMAISGSTNAIIHLVALAARCGIDLPLAAFDKISAKVPVLANVRPSGAFLMEDFYYAGGLTALMSEMKDLLHLDAMTVTGRTIGENLAGAKVIKADVIRPRENPLATSGGTAILYGSLAPDGAVIKTAAADPKLMQHTGRAVVFKDYDDMDARINREDLDVDENSVLVLQNAGPLGGPGMPEWGMLPIPQKVLKKGIRDMVRISDARMSGTSYGTCVLHVSPESFIGGPLALVEDGDLISLDVAKRRLDLLVSDEEMARRREAWVKPPARYGRGYGALYAERVTQAHRGCDFDFLSDGPATPEPAIH